MPRKKKSQSPAGWSRFTDACTEPEKLADMVFGWRTKLDITADLAAEVLGMSVRTLNGVEQGRGFRYPLMLVQAMLRIDEHWHKHRAALEGTAR
ncbi:DNA-binding transcriptional regulator YiaG [Sinorhizobium fredii]|uniref:hypothetical protein n=1 Tax=Rhizobium fredii TaxID=380 RepID=UPI0002F7FB6B|nr:hypothetical protein [Sinorhizobium fredii]